MFKDLKIVIIINIKKKYLVFQYSQAFVVYIPNVTNNVCCNAEENPKSWADSKY